MLVLGCHCDFCLRRTGSAYPVVAWFNESDVVEIVGARTVYNGAIENGEPGPAGLTNLYNFCPRCGATVFWTFEDVPTGAFPEVFEQMMPTTVAIGVGSFADPEFPPPTAHVWEDLRPTWLHAHAVD